MTKLVVLFSVAMFCGVALTLAAVDKPAVGDKKAGMLRHVVLFKFKDGTSEADIQKVVAAFGELPKKVDTIVDFEWGTDTSPEKKAQGFTHCFFVTFRDAAGRDTYLPHPAHKAFGGIAGPHLDKVLVVDYQAKQ